MAARRHTRIIGIGNPQRGDDGIGRRAAQHLREAALPGVEIVECAGETAELIALIEGGDRVILIDAASFGAAPGTIRRFDASREPLAEPLSQPSTHGLGLAQAIELARALGRLPPSCIVYAVEGRNYGIGAPLSPEGRRAAAAAAGQIVVEIAAEPDQLRSRPGCSPPHPASGKARLRLANPAQPSPPDGGRGQGEGGGSGGAI